ncbi:MAG: class I SAM-dependent methyltransferase [Sphaerobacter sp.]|nr:class I SAM-dependent methyltransferase [Sphaerobacter sp.]
MTTVAELYGDYWAEEESELEAALRTSLHPRGPDLLYELFAGFGIGPEDSVLDIGCRDAPYAVELARRFGCRVVAVDPAPLHVERARQRVAEADLTDRITVHPAGIEALPLADGSIAAIWCRDVLNHVALAPGLAECHRVLAPGGQILIYQTFATDALEPREAARLYAAIAIVPENMSPEFLEATARRAGFQIVQRDIIDSEWRERWQEEGERDLGADLLHLARLRRREVELVRRFGRARYEAVYGGLLWGIYQMLGKLCSTVYVLRKPRA